MENRSNLDKLSKFISDKPSKWLEEVEWREKNKFWLDDSAKIGLKILRELRDKNMTQKDLADKLNISAQQINKIVKGQENMTIETINKIGEELGIKLLNVPYSQSTIVLDNHKKGSLIVDRSSKRKKMKEMTNKITGVACKYILFSHAKSHSTVEEKVVA